MLTLPSPKLACTETPGLNFAEASAAVCSLCSGWNATVPCGSWWRLGLAGCCAPWVHARHRH